MLHWQSCLPQTDLFAPPAASLSEWAPEKWPVAPDWRPIIDGYITSPVGTQLGRFIQDRLTSGAVIYPPQPFLALQLTALADVKVVILGQDPYHGPGQAQGLAFSVPPGVRPPPSLRNIFKEINRDPKLQPLSPRSSGDGSLIHWAKQGVLMLNTCLTVEEGQPASHAKRGWENFTDTVVRAISMQDTPKVFLLWGAHAQAKQSLILNQDPERPIRPNLVLKANHPSPLSAMRPPAPFLGCGHFSETNAFLQSHGATPINWS